MRKFSWPWICEFCFKAINGELPDGWDFEVCDGAARTVTCNKVGRWQRPPDYMPSADAKPSASRCNSGPHRNWVWEG